MLDCICRFLAPNRPRAMSVIRGKHKRGNRTTRRLVQAIEQPQKLHVGDVP
jgi:hypothetical protein